MFREKLLSLPGKYPVTCLVVAALGGASGVWAVFSTRPLAAVLFERVGGVTMPAFPPYWITAPFAAIFLAIGIYYDRKRNSKLDKLCASLQESETLLTLKRKELSGVIGHTEIVSAQYEACKIKAEELQNLLNNRKHELEEKSKEHSEIRKAYLALTKQHGKFLVVECGKANQSLGLSVAVKYILPQDSDLAERITSMFYWLDKSLPPWKILPKENILDFRNPSESTRVVIFSDHQHAHGVMGAFNDYELLGVDGLFITEKVAVFRKGDSEKPIDADTTLVIVIFPKNGK